MELGVALRAEAAKGDFGMGDREVRRELPGFFGASGGREWDVKNGRAAFANEVAVLLEIGAIARGFALDVNLLDEAAFDERLEAVVNSGQRDACHFLLGAEKHFGGCRMIAIREEHIIHLATLRREAMAAMADRLLVGCMHFRVLWHGRNVWLVEALSRIIPNKVSVITSGSSTAGIFR